MQESTALRAFAALAHETRLAVLRLLECLREGRPVILCVHI